MRLSPGPPHLATVTSKFQLTIPQRLRGHYGLRPGDKVAVWTDGRSIFVKPYRQVSNELATV